MNDHLPYGPMGQSPVAGAMQDAKTLEMVYDEYARARKKLEFPFPSKLPQPVQIGAGHDPVNHPKHYTSHKSGVECIQITEWMSFNLGNVVKYLWRADDKGAPIEDLKKAKWNLEREIERREKMQR
jgi:hypothetical protein